MKKFLLHRDRPPIVTRTDSLILLRTHTESPYVSETHEFIHCRSTSSMVAHFPSFPKKNGKCAKEETAARSFRPEIWRPSTDGMKLAPCGRSDSHSVQALRAVKSHPCGAGLHSHGRGAAPVPGCVVHFSNAHPACLPFFVRRRGHKSISNIFCTLCADAAAMLFFLLPWLRNRIRRDWFCAKKSFVQCSVSFPVYCFVQKRRRRAVHFLRRGLPAGGEILRRFFSAARFVLQ